MGSGNVPTVAEGCLGRGEPQWEPQELSSPGKTTCEMDLQLSECLGWQPSSAAQACLGTHPPTSAAAAPRSDPSCPTLAWLISSAAVRYCTGVVTVSAALELGRVGVLVPHLPAHTCNTPRYKSVPLAGDAGPEASPFRDVLGGRQLCLPQGWRNPTCRRVSNASHQDILGSKQVEHKWSRFHIIYTHLYQYGVAKRLYPDGDGCPAGVQSYPW